MSTFFAATTASLATLLLVIVGTLALLSLMSYAPGVRDNGSGTASLPAVIKPPEFTPDVTAEAAAEPTTEPEKVPQETEPPSMLPGNLMTDAANLDFLNRLGTELNLTDTVGEYTVTLQRAYADANHIVVVYSIVGPEDGYDGVVSNTLLDASGQVVFAPMFGYTDAAKLGPNTYAYFFDTSALDTLPGDLSLHFRFDLANGTGFRFDLPEFPDVSDLNSRIVDRESVFSNTLGILSPDLDMKPEVVAGPFEFDFQVPVTSAETRVAEVGRTVEANGMKIRLDKVTVTPGEARLQFTFEAPTGDESPWHPVLTLEAGDYNSDDPPTNIRMETNTSAGTGTWTYSLVAPLSGKQGEWTVTISEVRSEHGLDFREGLTGELDDGLLREFDEGKTLTGPWVFKFTLPPAQ